MPTFPPFAVKPAIASAFFSPRLCFAKFLCFISSIWFVSSQPIKPNNHLTFKGSATVLTIKTVADSSLYARKVAVRVPNLLRFYKNGYFGVSG
jgi:hypothetical protein